MCLLKNSFITSINRFIMKYNLFIALLSAAIFCGCHKSGNTTDNEESNGTRTETTNGITYKVFPGNGGAYKGILVMGSGNDENHPSKGSLDGSMENTLCQKAAANGYLADIVQYRETPGNADWNSSAQMIGDDYAKCIAALAEKYHADKSKAVVGGVSYATFMLYTNVSYYNSLTFCKGVLGACGAISYAGSLKVPIFAINCSGNNEGNYNGQALYDQIPANSPVKAKSAGYTDNSCNTHCGGDTQAWVNRMYERLTLWLP